jgi:error-prone DNA polymerase
MGTPPYAELHCHSAYSFLDGASLPQELVHAAVERGYEALALTDHNSVSGSMEFAKAADEQEGPRTIHGAEIDVTAGSERFHLTLLVRDARGWSNLCRIVTHAHAHTRQSTGRARTEPSATLQTVLDHAQGLVCLTGCAGHGVRTLPIAQRLLDAFGPEGLRVELQRPYARHDRARNRALAALARRLGVACVASGNVHAHSLERAALQDAFVALRNHTTLDACEPLRRGNHTHAMSSPQAMASRFVDHPEAVRETLLLSEQLRFDLTKDLGYSYPGAEDERSQQTLTELCEARLHERYGDAEKAQAETRLNEELRVIEHLGLAGFFLLHHDMLELAREVAAEVRGGDAVRALLTAGRGRGSSVSSVVCYLTGLSHIDPIRNSLLLGRFLHEDLQGLPDIDLDFPREIRSVLIPRVHERYGSERAALVAAFPTFRTRGAIRELGKVLGLPTGEIERVARTAGNRRGELAEDIAAGRGAHAHGGRLEVSTQSARWSWLERLVGEAYGLPRHLSQHSGGMVVSTKPLIDCCPVAPAAMEGRQMVQWDKDSCADAGFLKIDLLGLGMLSAVERCVQEINRVRGERIDLSRIPFEDPKTFKAIREADTVGVFQIESRAQMQSLRRTLPESLDDLTVQVAIVRPGPIQGGAINPYIERRQRIRDEGSDYEIPYEHPALASVLADTLGTIIFQDQVMQVAEAFAGFSPGQANGLRRAMSRKRSHDAMQAQRESFIAGAMGHCGADLQTARRVWEMVEGFAGFGFPKAHAAAFGLLAYQSTWLRVHYGPEFLCALLNEQPMGFYAPDSLVHEAQRRRIPVLGLDINLSDVECVVEKVGVELGVRLGLAYVKGAVADEVGELVAERKRGGPFSDLADLAARAATRRGTLEQLAWAGACDSLIGGDAVDGSGGMSAADRHARRRLALWQLGVASRGERSGETAVQLALPIELPEPPRLRALDRWQRLLADYSTSEVTVDDHVMAALRSRLWVTSDTGKQVSLSTSAQLANLRDGSPVTVAGLVVARQRPGTAKGTMFLLFEDEFGTINLIVPGSVYERRRPLARAEPLLLARGRLERAPSGVINVLVRELERLERYLTPAENMGAQVRRLSNPPQGLEAEDPAEMGANMRAVAPPVQSFAAGRRR